MKKKFVSFLLASIMLFICTAPALATTLRQTGSSTAVVAGPGSIDETRIQRDNMNNDTFFPCVVNDENDICATELIGSSPVIGNDIIERDIMAESLFRGTSKPTKFWNIASKGIYNGSFTGVSGTIYTNYYFDWPADKRCYYTRLNVWANNSAESMTFQVWNYCKDCNEMVSSTDDIKVPSNYKETGCLYHKHSFTSKHDGHFLYPAVVCTAGKNNLKIDGTIVVNYTNSWT